MPRGVIAAIAAAGLLVGVLACVAVWRAFGNSSLCACFPFCPRLPDSMMAAGSLPLSRHRSVAVTSTAEQIVLPHTWSDASDSFERCRLRKQLDTRCLTIGWASTLYVGSKLPYFGYLPIPKSGTTMIRELLGPLLGFTFVKDDLFCVEAAIFEQLRRRDTRRHRIFWGEAPWVNADNLTCIHILGGVPPVYQLPDETIHSGWNGTTFTFVVDPLQHLYHGFAQTHSFRKSYTADAFLDHAQKLHGCVATRNRAARAHCCQVDIHMMPQSWHVENTLQGRALDHAWLLEEQVATGFPGLTKLFQRTLPAQPNDGHGRRYRPNLDPRLSNGGARGWAYLQSRFPAARLRALCSLLEADYACFGFARPQVCRLLDASSRSIQKVVALREGQSPSDYIPFTSL